MTNDEVEIKIQWDYECQRWIWVYFNNKLINFGKQLPGEDFYIQLERLLEGSDIL